MAKASVGILSLLPTVLLLSYMKTCATGDTSFFLKQLIVFMPELNEKDHRTVFITDGKPGLKELIQGTFSNVEVSECTFHMKVSLTKRLGGHKDKKVILWFFASVTNNTKKFKVE